MGGILVFKIFLSRGLGGVGLGGEGRGKVKLDFKRRL